MQTLKVKSFNELPPKEEREGLCIYALTQLSPYPLLCTYDKGSGDWMASYLNRPVAVSKWIDAKDFLDGVFMK